MGIPASNNYQGGFATGLMTKVRCCFFSGRFLLYIALLSILVGIVKSVFLFALHVVVEFQHKQAYDHVVFSTW